MFQLAHALKILADAAPVVRGERDYQWIKPKKMRKPKMRLSLQRRWLIGSAGFFGIRREKITVRYLSSWRKFFLPGFFLDGCRRSQRVTERYAKAVAALRSTDTDKTANEVFRFAQDDDVFRKSQIEGELASVQGGMNMS